MKHDLEGRRPYRGRRPSAARVRFLELVQSGMTSLQASREVGRDGRPGGEAAGAVVSEKHRRYTFDGVLVWEAPGHPKLPAEQKVISPRFLSIEERIEIADLHRARVGVRAIARGLGRSPATIS